MKLSDFLKDNLNKWVKIVTRDGVTIIQKVEKYEPVEKRGYYLCTGTSVCNADGELVKLNKFYTTKYHIMGNVQVFSDELAELEIKRLEFEQTIKKI